MIQAATIEQYLYQMHHSKSTVKSYLYVIHNFLSERSDAGILKYKDIISYLNEKEKACHHPNIKKQILPGIKKYYDYLIETGIRNDHPCRTLMLKERRSKDIILHDLFSGSELELLMEREERYPELKLRNQVVMSLLIYQGLTVSEVAYLKVQHIDLDAGRIFIKDSPKIARRHLEILPRQYRLLERYIHNNRKLLIKMETDTLAIGKLGTSLSADDVNYLVSTFKILFPDRNLCPATIRQSVIANWLNEKKLPLEQVQLMAGHRWISSTIKYRQNNIEQQRELMNKWFPLG
jgi:integrase/recombinase XerD